MKKKIGTIVLLVFKNIKSNNGALYLDAFILESDLGRFRKMLDSQQEVIDKDYRKVLIERFSHGSKSAKALYIKHIPEDSIGSLDYPYIPCYNSNDNKIYLNATMDLINPRGVGTTWYHEHGHYIDAALGYISDDNIFRKLLDQDALKYRDKYARKNHLASLKEVDLAIGKELSNMYLHSAVSDLLNGLTKGTILGVANHDLNYWTQDETAITSEAFAHMFECQFDKKRYEEMKKYFPHSLKYFEKMIRI